MSGTYVRHAMPGDTWLLLPTVKQSDIDELAALGVTPDECMRGGMEHSRRSFILFIAGEPAAMFGCVEHVTHGVPWSVVGTIVDRYPLPFLRTSRAYINSLPMFLENAVDVRNVKTIQWLRWLGFTIEKPRPMGLMGEPFHRFWRASLVAEKEQLCVGG
jgi:hypothetical protein